MKKSKRIVIYSVCSFFIVIYLCIFSLLFKENYTYSYRLYFIESKTEYWYGDSGLVVNFGEIHDYSGPFDIGLKGLQYLGDDFEFVHGAEEGEKILQLEKIKTKKSSTIYYEVEDEEIESYKIVLEIENSDKIDAEFYLNDKKIDKTLDENKIILKVEDVKRENKLNIKMSEASTLYSLGFERM